MLRKHEIELIARLVEGNLDDESEARALLERSEQARAEYEAQKTAYDALRSAGPVTMTESEKAALRRDTWTALRQDPQPKARKVPWYYKLAPVAAALSLVIGLAAVLTQGSNDAGEADSFDEISESLSADTTQADSGAIESAETTRAASGDGDDGAEADMADEEAAPTARSLEDVFAQIAEAVRTRDDMGDAAEIFPLGAREEVEEAARCLESAGLPNYSILGEFEAPSVSGDSPTTYLVVVQSNDEIGPDTQVVFIDTGTCRIAHVEG